MTHYLKQAAVVGVLSTVLAGVQLFAFTEPTLPPPAGNLPAPVTTGGVGQVKPGDLTISKPDNTALLTADKLVTIGGAILNTGGALNGLIVDKGNVGIGTSNPTQKLDVNGTIKALTSVCIGGDCRTKWPTVAARTGECFAGEQTVAKFWLPGSMGPLCGAEGGGSCAVEGGFGLLPAFAQNATYSCVSGTYSCETYLRNELDNLANTGQWKFSSSLCYVP